jgi:hypothetical protein
VKVVMTLLVRDEADIVDAQLAFHLHAGVDFVIATDNGSTDGTLEILERYRRAGVLHLLHETGDDMRQQEWVTRMARLAATDFGADWVINADADEFWWPRGGTLDEVLALVPERFGVVRGCWRHFLPRADGSGAFWERMTVRLCVPGPPGDKRTVYHAHQKVAHRAHPRVEVDAGNHDVRDAGLEPLRGWHPIEVLHFSVRSVEQLDRKSAGGWVRNPVEEFVEYQARLEDARRMGNVEALYDDYAVSDESLSRGLASGTLAIDTRLREVLRTLRAGDGTFPLPSSRARLELPVPSLEETAAYAAEASVLVSFDAVPRATQRVEALEERLAGLRTLARR